MDTSECYIFDKICACLALFGNIVKSIYPSVVDLIIYQLGSFELMIFVVDIILLRWSDTAMKFPVYP